MRDTTVGALLVFGAAAGFGTIGIFGEIALLIDLDLATLLPVRFVVATLVVTGLALARGWLFPQSYRDWLVTLGLGVVYTAMTVCFFVSLRFLTAGFATIILYTYPTFVVVLSAPVLGEPVTRRKLVSLALATGGVALVVGTGTLAVDLTGIGLALGAALFYALYTTGSRALSSSLSPRALMIGILVGATASMVVYGVVDGGLAVPTGRDEVGVILGIAIVATVVPHLLFYEGVARLEASRVGLVSTVEPVVTVALGALLLGEPVTLFVIAGGVLVVTGVLLVQSERSEPGMVPEAPAVSDPEK
ncbi:MAG: drug/metabolite transporter (DMT)-like permease [Haloarculaceae archaeon]